MADHPTDCPTCQRIRDAHKGGTVNRNELAKTLGIAPATVTLHAKHAGVTFDRSKTAVAVAARQVDLRARRQAIVQRLYLRAETNLTRLEADRYSYRIVLPGGGEEGASSEIVADEHPPSTDERNHSTAITAYLGAAAKLEQIDAGSNVDEAHSVLDVLAAGFKAAAAGYKPTADDLDP